MTYKSQIIKFTSYENGKDGTGVNILGSYETYEELDAAHPSGVRGDAYLIKGVLYVWPEDGSGWLEAGNIQGPQGVPGEQGIQGLQGPPGENGITYYTWIKYADTPTSGMSDSPDGKAYLGIAYNKITPNESSNYSDYTWSLTKGSQGIQGPPGENGVTYYTWIKYADDKNGSNMSDDPTGKEYIGLAYNKTSQTESNKASDYTWSLFKGDDGTSPYLINLSNDSATIGTNANGGGYTAALLQSISTTTVSVFEGTKNITSNCTFSWTVTNGTLNNNNTSSIYFTVLNADSAIAKVTVKKDNITIGTKEFTISKVKQGQTGANGNDAVTYVLSVSPNSWNLTGAASLKPVVKVIKYVGDTVTIQTIHAEPDGFMSPYPASGTKKYEYAWYGFQSSNTYSNNYSVNDLILRNGEYYKIKVVGSAGLYSDDIVTVDYVIKANGSDWTGAALTDTTTFELWVDGKSVDSETVSAVRDGATGDKGDPGKNGTDGKGIKNITNYYLASTQKSGITTGTGGWSTNIQTTDTTNKYLWNYEKIEYTSGDPLNTTPRIIGTHGETGSTGRGISSIEEKYMRTPDNTVPSSTNSSWSATIPELTNSYPYLWCKETINYTTSDAPTIFITLMAQKGADGSNGKNGTNGTNGTNGSTGTKTEAIRIFISSSTYGAPAIPSNNTTSLGNWTTTEMTASSSAKYVYTSTGVKTTTYSGTTAQTPTYGDFTAPELWSAWLNANVNPKAYSEFLKLTNNGTSQGIKTGEDGQIYFNASYINTGTFTVSNGGKALLTADCSNGTVSLAGWTVNANSLTWGTLGNSGSIQLFNNGGKSGTSIAGSGTGVNWALAIGSDFGVSTSGAIYASSGVIGGCNIVDGTLKITNANIDEKLTANEIDVSSIKITNANISEKLSFDKLPENVASKDQIPSDYRISEITNTTITSTTVTAPYLKVEIGNVQGLLEAGKIKTDLIEIGNANIKEAISFENLPSNVATYNDIPSEETITEITKNYITTETIEADYLKVKIANVTGLLDAYGRITGTFSGTVFGTGTCNLNSIYFSGTTITFLKPEGGWYDTVVSASGVSTNNLQATGGSLSGMTSISTDSISATSISAAGGSLSDMTSISTSSISASGGNLSGMGSISSAVYNSIGVQCDEYGTNYIRMWAGSNSTSLSSFNHGINFNSNGASFSGTWAGTSSIATTSDINRKNTIKPILQDSRYDILYDALIPVTYKYNDGTSGRTHTGYIAQDVLSAMEEAELTTTEFAGYVKAIETDRETEIETEVCCLRYEEFVALNTDQIQKLKRRVINAEAEIALLKEEILCLRE